MEEGSDTKNIVKNYVKLKKLFKVTKLACEDEKDKYRLEMQVNKEKLSEVH